eukprot:scaffold294_cov221-Amphora_coffeaeformis.AAC.40
MNPNEKVHSVPSLEVRCGEEHRDDENEDESSHSCIGEEGRWDNTAAVACHSSWKGEVESTTAQSETSGSIVAPLVVIPLCSPSSTQAVCREKEETKQPPPRQKDSKLSEPFSAEDYLLYQLLELNHSSSACIGLEDDRDKDDIHCDENDDNSSLCTESTVDTIPSSCRNCQIEWSLDETEIATDDIDEQDKEEDEASKDLDPLTFDLIHTNTTSSSSTRTSSSTSAEEDDIVTPLPPPHRSSSTSAMEALARGDDSYFTDGFIFVGDLPRIY